MTFAEGLMALAAGQDGTRQLDAGNYSAGRGCGWSPQHVTNTQTTCVTVYASRLSHALVVSFGALSFFKTVQK